MACKVATNAAQRLSSCVAPSFSRAKQISFSHWLGSTRFLSKQHSHCRPDRIRSMATKAELKCWVKGDPATETLGDCPFCHKVLLTMEEKGLTYNKGYIDFTNKPAWLLEVNPAGSVPVLHDGDKYVPDSGDIVKYLEEKFPEPAVAVDEEGSAAVGGIFGAFRNMFVNKDDDKSKELEANLLAELGKLNALLESRGGPFLGGETLNASDAAVLPQLYHMKSVLGHYKGFSIPDSLPKVTAYMLQASERPSWKNTHYPPEMVIQGWGAKLA